MIQRSRELAENVSRVQSIVGRGYLQKIYSSSTLVCLSVRFRQCTQYLYLGRGCGVEGFWLAEEKIPAELRKIDRFLEYLRKHLCAKELVRVSQVYRDRCVELVYRSYGHDNFFFFFWKGRRLYFLNYFFDCNVKNFCILKSWHGKNEITGGKKNAEDLHQMLLEVGLNQEHLSFTKESSTSASLAIKGEKLRVKQLICSNKKIKSLQRKRAYIYNDLEKIKSAADLQSKLQLGELDINQLGGTLEFKGIKITFDKKLNSFQKRDRVFKKIKGYKKARIILEARKSNVEQALQSLRSGNFKIDKNRLKTVEPYWVMPRNNKAKNTAWVSYKIKVFKTKNGITFAVGIDAESNDFLRSKWGGRNDFWFHLDGYSGPHLVIKEPSRENINTGLLEVIASAIRDFSGKNLCEIPLVFTQVKNLKGVKGTKGKIIYKREKYIKMNYDRNWRERVEEL